MDARTSPGSAAPRGDAPEAPDPGDGEPGAGAVVEPAVAAVFAATPGINLLLAADPPRFTMLAASDERLAATLTTREETLGRPLFEVFSDGNPENDAPSGVANLRASLETVLRTRAPHRMAVQRYDVQRADGTWEVRHWAPRNVPVLDPDGRVRYVVHHVEDVTDAARRAAAHDQLRGEYVESESARRELEDANEQLQEQHLELELANQQLQDQSAELELQTEELRLAATELEDRTVDAERARAEADAATRRLAFLADAGERLAASLDHETTLRDVLALAVPTIADWALYAVDAGDGTLRLAASRHAEPAMEAFIAESARRYPIRADEPAGAARVLRTGEAELIPEVADAVLEAVARDREHLEILRAVGFRSLMMVPVRVQGRTLGALGLVTGRSGRVFGPEDLTLAQALAHRAATALDRARLYAEAETARREAEAERARAAGILETMADAHFVLDADFRIVSVNAAMERATGLSRDALLGRVMWEAFPGAVGSEFERHYRAAATEGATAHFTDVYEDGRLALVAEADVAPVAGGGVAVFWRDVTARVRAEGALRESEARFRNMADAAPVMLWVTEPDGACSFLNRAWLDFTGQALDERPGYRWLDAVHPDDRPRAERDFAEANARRAPFRADYRLRRRDGVYRWAVDAAAPRIGPGGEYLGYVGSVLDVDERTQLLEAERAARRAAEEAQASAEALRERAEASEALARQLFALSPVPKWVYDAETLAFLDVNDAATRHYGYTRAEFLAMTIRDIRPPEEIPRMLALAHAPHPVGVSQGVFHHRIRSGEIIDVEVFLRDIAYEGRRAVIAVVQDVTERRRGEAALREASRAAAAARDVAEAANAAKSQFLSTMSHELRTPLNAIGGYADLLVLGLRGPLTETQRHDLERVRLANQHLMSLVTDVLNFARLDAGQLEYRLADVELATIVAELEPLIGPQLVAKGIAFDHDACAPDTPDRPHLVRADPEKLRQILLNLLTNAVKFTERGGRVALACETDAAARVVRVRLADTGRGIPPDQLERIFEPFVQVDRHRTPDSQQGVGLGLAISRDLARAMGGDITVESAPGAGSTFTLTLPAA